MGYISLPLLSHTAGAHSYQWVTSLQGELCIPREVRACHWCKRLAKAQRERFNCSLCHVEIVSKALVTEKVASNKWCCVTSMICFYRWLQWLMLFFEMWRNEVFFMLNGSTPLFYSTQSCFGELGFYAI